MITNELTFEELRDAAEKLGYKLVKKRTYISLKPCPICGRKYTAVWHSMKSDLNQAWNDAVDRYLKGKGD